MTVSLALVAAFTPVGVQAQVPCEDDPVEVADADELHHGAVAAAMQAKYESLRKIHTEAELDSLDAAMAGFDRLDDAVVTPVLTAIGILTSTNAIDDLNVGEEISKSAETADVLKDVVQIAQGAAPTLHTYVSMHERSNHEDYWTFFAKVYTFGGCLSLGDTYANKALKDNYAKTDHWDGYLELPLENAAEDVSQISHVEVKLHVKVCHYGWYSGKLKGCSSGLDSGEIQVEWLG